MQRAGDQASDNVLTRGDTIYRASGDGPTVALDPGLLTPDEIWVDVATSVAAFARVVLIDRPDVRSGSPRLDEASPIRSARESRAAILSFSGDDTVTMVGWSVGAMFARAFTAESPENVQHLVLVEPLPEEVFAGVPVDTLSTLRRLWSSLDGEVAVGVEQAIVTRMQRLTPLNSVSRVALTLITGDRPISDNPDIVSILDASHARYLAQSSRSRHVIAGRSGHRLPIDRPDVIVDIVREIIQSERAG